MSNTPRASAGAANRKSIRESIFLARRKRERALIVSRGPSVIEQLGRDMSARDLDVGGDAPACRRDDRVGYFRSWYFSRTWSDVRVESVFGGKADMGRTSRHVTPDVRRTSHRLEMWPVSISSPAALLRLRINVVALK